MVLSMILIGMISFLVDTGTSLALGLRDTADAVGGPWLPLVLTGSFGCTGNGCTIVNVVTGIVAKVRPLVGIGGIFVITLTGFRMVVTEEEETFTKSTKIISATVSGVILMYLIEPFVNSFYGGITGTSAGGVFGGFYQIGTIPSGNMAAGASILSTEILGLINWALVIVGILTVFLIIVSGIRAIVQGSSEEGLTQLRRTIIGVITGILIIVFSQAINRTFGLNGVVLPGTPTINPAAVAVVRIIQFILGFMALIAVAVIVYAGFRMVLNFGNEENFRQARSLIIRVGIGLVVIFVSIVLINFVVSAVTG